MTKSQQLHEQYGKAMPSSNFGGWQPINPAITTNEDVMIIADS